MKLVLQINQSVLYLKLLYVLELDFITEFLDDHLAQKKSKQLVNI